MALYCRYNDYISYNKDIAQEVSVPKLCDVADIYSGYAVQARVDHDPEGNVIIVRGADVSRRNEVDWSEAVRIRVPEKKNRRLLQAGDVLIKAIGMTNTAVLVSTVPEEIGAVPHQHFLHIRLKDSAWDPAFLSIFLNSEQVQVDLRSKASGATQAVLRRGVLEEFELPSLAIEEQRKWIKEWETYLGRVEKLEQELSAVRNEFSSSLADLGVISR